MNDYVDDSELANVLRESRQVMLGLSGRVEMSSEELLELAKKMADATNSYTGSDSKPATHFVENKAKAVKSKIGTHIEMLKRTASSICELREKINGSGDKPLALDLKEIANSETADKKLSEYNQKIDDTLKYLATKTKGKTEIEKKIKKFRDIMGEVEGAIKNKTQKQGKDRNMEFIDKKFVKKVNDKIYEMSSKMREAQQNGINPYEFQGYGSSEEEGEIGDWVNYEGFNCKEDLDKYNEIFKRIVGETPEEYTKRYNEEVLDMDEKTGKFIYKNQKDKTPKSFKAALAAKQSVAPIKNSEELEKRLKEVLSLQSARVREEGDAGSVLQERRFLDHYLGKKLNDTVHTIEDRSYKRESAGKKKNESTGSRRSEKPSEEFIDSLSFDGPGTKSRIPENTTPRDLKSLVAGKSSKKTDKLGYMNELKMESPMFDIPKPNAEKSGNEQNSRNIQTDMERIKKLILKERQEHLRKKRDAWERNNELSEEIIDREELRTIKKPSRFDIPVPNAKPSPMDFITERERREEMYRTAVKGKKGLFHKEDLEYEFGVNPFYSQSSKNDKDTNGGKPIRLRGYEGVRKRSQT